MYLAAFCKMSESSSFGRGVVNYGVNSFITIGGGIGIFVKYS